MTSQDALLLMLEIAEVGVPFVGMQTLSSFREGATPELAERITAQEDTFRERGVTVGRQIVAVEARLVRGGLPLPPRPESFARYLEWSAAIVAAVAGATGADSEAGALAALGKATGELSQTVALRLMIAPLRAAAPADARLTEHEAQLVRGLAEASRRVEELARFPSLPQVARAAAAQLAAHARLAVSVDQRAGAGGLGMVQQALFDATRALRASIAA